MVVCIVLAARSPGGRIFVLVRQDCSIDLQLIVDKSNVCNDCFAFHRLVLSSSETGDHFG